jgi:sterol desaturase/sphingolipid hydroxylase (fatty acid hydroxylase superfamily)
LEPAANAQSVFLANIYFAAVALIAGLEALRPRRALRHSLRQRWTANLFLALVNYVLVRLLTPALGLAFASLVATHGWGLFALVAAPFWLTLPIAFIITDFARYLQHYAFHYAAPLWRFHAIHHSDPDFDFTTGLRFHPVEWLAITAMELGLIAALGVPPLVYLICESVHTIVVIFSHGNVTFPNWAVERWLRRLVVTSEMHRIHHSAAPAESNGNFSNVLPWWDHWFGTYVDQPVAGHEAMMIGLPELRDARPLQLTWVLAYPFTQRGVATR